MNNFKISAVIPTRNRPEDLEKAVLSVIEQIRRPNELMIVDQSSTSESKVKVLNLIESSSFIGLNYIHDSSISGLVAAKRVAASNSIGDIVCFLEDDVVLEADYFEQIETAFRDFPEMIGGSGIVTNPPPQSRMYQFMFNCFHRGIFFDIRPAVYSKYENSNAELNLIQSDKISGGLSAWRKEVFEKVKFDETQGFFMLEDIDFSTRVAKEFGQKLFINPKARLAHYFSPANREKILDRQERKIIEIFKFYKERKSWDAAKASMIWLIFGLAFEAVFKAVLSVSFGPILAFFKGFNKGIKIL